MAMFVTFTRTTKFAAQNFWRNLWLSIITMFILALTVYLVSVVGGINVLADQAIKAVEEKIDVDIFFRDDVSESDIIAAQIYLEGLPQVTNVRYVSKADALESFKEANADNADISTAIDELGKNPLPASLVVQASRLDDYDAIMRAFEQSEYDLLTEKKNYQDYQIVIDRLSAITLRLYQAGLAISVMFVLISIVLMYNTIRLAIYSQREELAIMKLVGATNAFIRSPFILEGAFYAIGATIFAFMMLWFTTVLSSPYINAFFEGYNFAIDTYFYQYIGVIILFQFGFSLILAVSSSMISIGRYLKV